jgi:hypothetical protein
MREKPRSREQECRRAQARQPLARQRSAFRPQWETARRPSPEPRPKEWNLQALAGLREPADSACLQAVRRQFETYDVLTENRGVAGSIPALATSRNGCKALTSIAGASERRPAPTGRVGLFRPFSSNRVRNCGLWSDGRDDDGFVWALRIRTGNREWLAEARRHNDLLSRTVPLAVELWHEPCVSLRDGNELLCICGRCSALGYGDAAEGVVGGALFEDECPNEGPPAITALTVRHVARSRWPSGR